MPARYSRAVLGRHPGAAAVLQQQPGDPLAAEHGAAVVGQVPGEGRGQLPGPADRDRPAALLAAERLRVGQHPRAGLVARLEDLEGHPEQERLDVPALELMPDHLHRGQLPPPCPDLPPRMLGEPALQRRPESHRGELGLAEDVLDLVVLVEQAEVGGGVRLGEPGHLLGGPVPVQPHGELLAVRERDVLHRIGLGVTQAVAGGQAELVAAQRRVDPDHRVPGRAGVDAEPGQQQLLGGRPAAGDRPCVQDQAPVAGLGQVAGGEQAVMPGPRHHDVGVVSRHPRPAFPKRPVRFQRPVRSPTAGPRTSLPHPGPAAGSLPANHCIRQ